MKTGLDFTNNQVDTVKSSLEDKADHAQVKNVEKRLENFENRSKRNNTVTLFFFFIRTSNFAAEAEPKLNVLIFSRFEPKMFLACS